MSDLSDIKKTREHWYQAYFDGNTETLKQIEASDFYVSSAKGKQARDTRYESIQQAIKSGQWFEANVFKEEDALQFLLNDGKAKISGHGRMLSNGKPFSDVIFEENWIKSKQGWQVKALHLHNSK
ncbi:hypothetical protein NBRC116188_04270 [Oceaniserpentilla sp. 4NH20-0058]|uniref:hypothetical protein n=1 Tax=Oceaniserpentilla sp. 4NH20-0058 TaxID=3127660 RepID=UPI003101E4AC